ncbi:hypothetical protein SLEP1_g48022 [Rubroshorea leprosula]|uniref:Reverse transcriptase domain-containing protein n=1 Tax=Rubroshorea leprosula TaxID=152421 RepID=A0AAV5LT85_9ROSI|nr:hypothetical protein SLEP1_g48022 [Rubroshorea leprosula]
MVCCGRDLPRRLGGSVALLQTELVLAFSIRRADLCGSVSSSAAGEQQMRMARRLGGWTASLPMCRTTPLAGRQLVDGVLVLHEVVEEVKRRKQSAFVFKADFAKAYYCVDWSFLEWMMDRLGFGIKWRGWIMECLSTSKISVLVNESPTEEFKVEKGLRQGDPLSPFLFLMIGEGLNGLVQKAVLEGMFRGIEIGRKGLAVSLLQFADDTVIIGKADIENIIMVKTIL